ncbi:unnamed protein product [Polarella glacialis]|uniref:Dipeptidase n=1 Tax=Polarella glacialis TaxID=89957 RepID=A0A813F7B0_POLGL|nr:unnamed protein product [Polarella glacialis]
MASKGVLLRSALAFCFARAALGDVDGCTALAVGKKATVEGSTVTTHNNDCSLCDPRIAYVPARDHAEGATRPLAPFRLEYPRYVGTDRSDLYRPMPGQKDTVPVGHVAQVPHTYAYWEGTYPLVNEHGLGMGESTCSSKLIGVANTAGGTALFSVSELMKIGMERCKTSRCAIQVMGDLAVEHGFFGEDPGQGGAGEAVTLADRDESWVFHVTAGLNGSSATWVAQRVPDDHIAIIANHFGIKKVNCKESDTFMCSPNIFSNARAANLCSFETDEDFDFLGCYAPDIRTFSYMAGYAPIPYYTTLRLWRIHSLATQNDHLTVTNNPFDYAFSVPVAGKISVETIMNYTRDHYADTDYDMTKGVLSGTFGNPNRLEGGVGMQEIRGQFARGFSIPRTSYSVVVQSRHPPERSIAWLAADQPMTSVFVPFVASAKRAAAFYQTGQQEIFSRDCAWWAFNFVSNWMTINFQDMMAMHVGPKIKEQQDIIMKAVKTLDEQWPESDMILEEVQIGLQEHLVGERFGWH